MKLVWSAEYYNVADAFTLEKQIQGWSRAKRLALIEGRFADLPALAKRRGKAGSGVDESAGASGGFDAPSASASDGSTT